MINALYAFPVAMLATALLIALYVWGRSLHQKEIQTGKEPKGANWFVIVLVSCLGGIYLMLGRKPMFDLFAGIFMGGGITAFLASFGTAQVRRLVQAMRQ